MNKARLTEASKKMEANPDVFALTIDDLRAIVNGYAEVGKNMETYEQQMCYYIKATFFLQILINKCDNAGLIP